MGTGVDEVAPNFLSVLLSVDHIDFSKGRIIEGSKITSRWFIFFFLSFCLCEKTDWFLRIRCNPFFNISHFIVMSRSSIPLIDLHGAICFEAP